MDHANVRHHQIKPTAGALPAIFTRHLASDRSCVSAIYVSPFILSPIGTVAVPPSPRPASH